MFWFNYLRYWKNCAVWCQNWWFYELTKFIWTFLPFLLPLVSISVSCEQDLPGLYPSRTRQCHPLMSELHDESVKGMPDQDCTDGGVTLTLVIKPNLTSLQAASTTLDIEDLLHVVDSLTWGHFGSSTEENVFVICVLGFQKKVCILLYRVFFIWNIFVFLALILDLFLAVVKSRCAYAFHIFFNHCI